MKDGYASLFFEISRCNHECFGKTLYSYLHTQLLVLKTFHILAIEVLYLLCGL